MNALGFLVLTVAGWLNRHQEDVIEYLREENRILREQLGGRRIRLTDAQRRRLAVRGKKLGPGTLSRLFDHTRARFDVDQVDGASLS